MHVGAVRKQDFHDIRMLLRDRPHERRLAACGARVHVRSLGDELLHGFDEGIRIAQRLGDGFLFGSGRREGNTQLLNVVQE